MAGRAASEMMVGAGAAFKKMYGVAAEIPFKIIMKGGESAAKSLGSCKDVGIGGCTVNNRVIYFASMNGDDKSGGEAFLRDRNNVAHELGHAFNFSLELHNKEITSPFNQLSSDMNNLLRRGNDPKFNYGFASTLGDHTWQMAYTNVSSSNEIFADQFLAWTFNTFSTNQEGSDAAIERSKWMNEWMPVYLNALP